MCSLLLTTCKVGYNWLFKHLIFGNYVLVLHSRPSIQRWHRPCSKELAVIKDWYTCIYVCTHIDAHNTYYIYLRLREHITFCKLRLSICSLWLLIMVLVFWFVLLYLLVLSLLANNIYGLTSGPTIWASPPRTGAKNSVNYKDLLYSLGPCIKSQYLQNYCLEANGYRRILLVLWMQSEKHSQFE